MKKNTGIPDYYYNEAADNVQHAQGKPLLSSVSISDGNDPGIRT